MVAASASECGFVAASLACAAVLAGAILYLGHDRFPAADAGPLTALAWRLHLGERPYAEVVTAMPPIFVLPAGAAFELFGVSWSSLVIVAAIFAASTFLAHVAILSRLRLGAGWVLSIALATQATTTLLTSFWWYNAATSVLGALFLSTSFLLAREPSDRLHRLLFASTGALLLLAKVNVAAVLFAGSALSLAAMPRTRSAALVGVAGAVVGSLAILAAAGIDPRSVLACYGLESGRFSDSLALSSIAMRNDRGELLATAAQAIPLVLVGAWPLRFDRDGRAFTGLFLAAVATAGAGFLTNREMAMVDAVPIAIGAALRRLVAPAPAAGPDATGDGMVRDLREGRARFATGILLASLALHGIWGAAVRSRVAAAGGGRFYEERGLARLSAPPFFRGLRTGPAHREVLELLAPVLANGGGSRVFVNPRLAFAYPAFGLPPPRGLPVVWDAYCDEGRPGASEMLAAFERAEVDVGVTLREDEQIRIPDRIRRHFHDGFEATDVGPLRIYRRVRR